MALLMVFLKNALMCMKKVRLINHCLPMLMLLYIMLAYLMLLDALSNAVYLHNFFLGLLMFASVLCFHAMSEHIGLVVRMSILDTEVDGSNPSISMFFP